jgi:autotransporter-associated beta strand protein
MKTPIKTPTTRASLLSTASCNNRWFASLLASSAVLGSPVLASNWEGDTSADWNDNLNWQGDAGNVGNAVINTVGGGNPPFTATISTNATQPVVDIFVGINAGQTGRLDHTAGTAATGGGNWFEVGTNGGTGTYNLTGSGSMNAQRLYVGGSDGGGRTAAGSNGTVTVNTTGGLTTVSDLIVGEFGGTGTFNLDSGTVTTGGWNFCGRRAGSVGTMNISGGTLTNAGRFYIGENATGTVNQTGGTMTNGGEVRIGQGAGGNATLNLSAGTFSANGWCLIGREGSNGTLNLSGTGTFIKNSGDPFAIGNDPGVGSGTLNQTGGTLTTANGSTMRIGGHPDSTGTWNMSGGTATIGGQIRIGSDGNGTLTMDGGTINAPATISVGASSTGTFTLNAGTLNTNQINGGTGIDTTTFNGTQIVATTPLNPFIGGLDNPTIGLNGLKVDTNGADAVVTQAFSGVGGVVKSGAGTLTLSGANSYEGDNLVNAGGLVLSADASGTGAITLADGTTLGVSAPFAGDQLGASGVTFGTTAATTLNLNLGDVGGFNPTDSILDVTGPLAVNGAVTVNVAGAKFSIGEIPLISYNAAQRTGSGTFVLGNLPPGVVATLETDVDYFGTGLAAVYLDVTSVALPEWDGTNEVVLEKFGDTLEASAVVTVTDATGIVIGQAVRGAGIPVGATVTAINGLDITLSQPATATAALVDLRFVVTAGTDEGIWNTTTQNWVDQVTTLGSIYADPNPVLFSDTATGPTAVVLNQVVNPSVVTFNNNILAYSLTGSGAINGPTGLLKQGTQPLAITGISNTYTGVTRLEGGTTTVDTLTNGGIASPLGAASADPANLVLAGGTLEYTGGALTLDRGVTIAGNSGLVSAADLTFTGPFVRTAGGITKTGAGNLTLTNATNAIGTFRINGGNLAFDGSGGPQVNNANGFFMGAGVNVTLPNDTTLNSGGDVNIGDTAGAVSTLTLSGNAVFNSPNRVMTGVGSGGNSTGDIMVSGTSQFNLPGGWFSVGETGEGTLTVKDSGKFYQATSDFNISDLNGSTGTFNLQDSGQVDVNFGWFAKNPNTTANVNISGGTFNTRAGFMAGGLASDAVPSTGLGAVATINQTGGAVTFNGDSDNRIGANATAVWNISAGSILSNGWMTLGRYVGGSGTMNASGGTVTQNHPDRPFRVGENGTGILNVSGTADVVAANAGGFSLGGGAGSAGTINLNGGMLTANRIYAGGADGVSTVVFNGGVLRAAIGANLNFLAGIDAALVSGGGAVIDTNGQTVAIGQVLEDDGGDLTKQGGGTLQLNGANSYFGTTTVAAGSLGGTGSVAGPLVVSATGTVAPGAAIGTFTAGDTTVSGSYACEIDATAGDKLVVAGALAIDPGAVLDFNELAAPTAPAYIVATYFSRTGSFTPQDLPAGYSLDHNFVGGNQIALVSNAITPFQLWAYTNGLDPLTDGAPGADPDGDGQSNGIEFALGGDPTDGGDNAKVFHLAADSGDAGAEPELLMTIAVLSGTPAFGGSPSPTATHQGATYTVQGSANLGTFTSPVSVVAPVTTGLPAAPAGYEYRTFSLDGSNGLPSKGFLRVEVTP